MAAPRRNPTDIKQRISSLIQAELDTALDELTIRFQKRAKATVRESLQSVIDDHVLEMVTNAVKERLDLKALHDYFVRQLSKQLTAEVVGLTVRQTLRDLGEKSKDWRFEQRLQHAIDQSVTAEVNASLDPDD